MPEKTDRQLVDEANELARRLASVQGFQVPANFRFEAATNPRARVVWEMVRIAYEVIEGTSIEDAVTNLEDEQPAFAGEAI